MLNENNDIHSIPHVVFSYCFLGIITYLYYNKKYEKFNINNTHIKRWLGYYGRNKTVDYLIKKNGVLHSLNLVDIVTNKFIRTSKNQRLYVPLVVDESKKSHTFNIKLFMDIMEDEDFNIGSFYVMNYINEIYDGDLLGKKGFLNDIVRKLKLKYIFTQTQLKLLNSKGYLHNEIYDDKESVMELNLFLRSKLNHWTKNSLIAHDNKCFISGSNTDLVVHHIIPFNTIRDEVLSNLGIEIKKLDAYTTEELDMIESMFIDYHKIHLGVPLERKLHIKFHRMYGHNVGVKELLDFKSKINNT